VTWAVAILALYGAGILGSVSPCVLPLLPGVALVLADGRVGASRVARMLLFAACAATTFAVLGVLAGGARAVVGANLAARVAGAGLILLAAVTVAVDQGVWRAPQWAGPRAGMHGWGFPIAMGVGCGAVWSPCVGPLLGVAATAAAGTGSWWRGATLLFAFGAGVASPAVALALVRVPVPGWARGMGRVSRRLMPVAMVTTGALLVTGWYTPVVQQFVSGR
jgi:cytochrome c-type biogenesis protein